ncbi:MAG: HAMP domain-containing histidine kinase [Prolixibacteraceae bacterium]|nr:HAMP domain-containing histidine kinase [Prolixibacteraceae bacterium]
MKKNAFKYIIILGVLVILGIFMIQFLVLERTYNINEKQFNESAMVALREVAWQLLETAGQTSQFDNIEPVKRHENHLYIVNVNYYIDLEILKIQLREQLKSHEIHVDFDYAVYDNDIDEMVYIEHVCANTDSCEFTPTHFFPKSDKYTYYFVVNFPTIKPYIGERLTGWYFMTSLLMLVLIFFGYTTWVIIKQRQLSEIQKIFINNLTHELKTPISSIGLAGQVISDQKILETPDRLFNYVRIINDQTKRLSSNVEKVLNLATLEKNKLTLSLEILEINSFTTKSVSRFKQSELGANITINTIEAEHEIYVDADPFHLANIIQNMLENAVKYCNKEPEINVVVEKKRSCIHLMIQDNGIGIPKESRKKIFKKFYRVPTGNVHDVKGFGLGLDYVHRLMKAHHWKIWVSDNPNGGSIFTLEIPIKHE